MLTGATASGAMGFALYEGHSSGVVPGKVGLSKDTGAGTVVASTGGVELAESKIVELPLEARHFVVPKVLGQDVVF